MATIRDKLKEVKWGAVIIENGELSMGRVMAWVVFFASFWFWLKGQDLPTTMFDILLVLFAYNFGKKFTGPLAQILGSRLSDKTLAEQKKGSSSPTKVTVVDDPFDE